SAMSSVRRTRALLLLTPQPSPPSTSTMRRTTPCGSPSSMRSSTSARSTKRLALYRANMGRRSNQNCVDVPHAGFVAMLSHKAALVGIRVLLTEESYTGKASFLDTDPLPVYDSQRQKSPTFSGKRVKRGRYQTASRRHINADVNGAYNILRKVLPDAFGN